jgi:hypothetical protein
MNIITAIEAVTMMEGLDENKHPFVGVTTQTFPKFLVKSRVTKEMFVDKFKVEKEQIVKVSNQSAQVGLVYADLIYRRLIAEGKSTDKYESGESWHIPYNDTRTIRQHKTTGELYFYLFLTPKNKPDSFYLNTVTGAKVDKEELADFLPLPSIAKNQGLETENIVHVETLKLASLKRIAIDKQEYMILG